MRDIEFIEKNKECSYFSNEISDIRYKYMEYCDKNDYQNMLEHGWRRFGKMNFVPECKECTKCISLRINVNDYKFSSSEKRVISKNKDINIYIQEPTISKDHLLLYNKYHLIMSKKKNWPYAAIQANEYIKSYVEGKNDYTKEILYVKNNNLIAVALTDILEESISSIYCYYDHDYEYLSLGKFSILTQINIAKKMNIPYIYLGYWIKDHRSMGYKISYKPFEILYNRANLNEKTIWKKYE